MHLLAIFRALEDIVPGLSDCRCFLSIHCKNHQQTGRATLSQYKAVPKRWCHGQSRLHFMKPAVIRRCHGVSGLLVCEGSRIQY